ISGSAGPWSVTWSDGLTQNVSTAAATRIVSPSSTTTYMVTVLIDTGTGCQATTLTGGAAITVNPVPLAPTNPLNATNCVRVSPNPALSVTPDSTGVTGTVVIDWYDAASG